MMGFMGPLTHKRQLQVHKFGRLIIISSMLTFECVIAGEVGRGLSSRAVGECAPRNRAQTEDRDASACPCRFTEGGGNLVVCFIY